MPIEEGTTAETQPKKTATFKQSQWDTVFFVLQKDWVEGGPQKVVRPWRLFAKKNKWRASRVSSASSFSAFGPAK